MLRTSGADIYALLGQALGVGPTINTGVSGQASGATTNYAIRTHAGQPSAGANNWAIYSASQAKSYLAGTLEWGGGSAISSSSNVALLAGATFTGAISGTTATFTTVTAALTGNVTGNVTGSSGSSTGNAATATALATGRTINGTTFDGTGNITVTAAGSTLTGSTLQTGFTNIPYLSSANVFSVSGNTFTTDLKVLGAEAGAATLHLWADEGDDLEDKFLLSVDTASVFTLEANTYKMLTISDLTSTGGARLQVGSVSSSRQVDIVSSRTSGANVLAGYIDIKGGDSAGAGAYIKLHRTSGATPVPGFLLTESANDTSYSIFVSDAGDARIWAGTGPYDAAGTVIGTQTSTLATKHLTHKTLTPNAALATILATPIRSFTYRSGSYSNTEFYGIIADWSPAFAMDRGQSFNPVSAFGYSVQAIKALNTEIDGLRAEIAELRGRKHGR